MVSFESVKQELKADARLQFSDSLAVDDESFVRAAVKFADAFVKGDAAGLKPMLGRRGAEVLGLLEDRGEFVTKGVEQLRVTYAAGVPADMALETGFPPDDPTIAEAKEVLNTYKTVYSQYTAPEDRRRVQGMVEKILREVAKKLKDQGRESEYRQVDQYLIRLLNMPALKPGNIFRPSSTMVMLTAVQEPAGSYLVGWQASKDGEKWVFDPASTTDAVKARASDWDAVGVNGFALVSTVETVGKVDDLKPADGKDTKAPASPTPVPGGGPMGG
ncbi:MAG: hypothetical protein JNK35_12435 [Phycisphaerae bacterium]|nr:hypothetical protein [Phycisphaerae bacterium]